MSEPILDKPADESNPPRPLRRRNLLRWGLIGAAAVAGAGAVGYEVLQNSTPTIRLGIAPGTQTLWRYVAQRKDELLGSLGYNVNFMTFPDEDPLRTAFANGEIDIMASLVPTLASLAVDGIAAQMFLPIAWLREGYPFIVPQDSSISDLKGIVGRRIATYPMTHPGMAYWRSLALVGASVNLAALHPQESLDPASILAARKVDVACMSGTQWALLATRGPFRKLTDLQMVWTAISGNPRLLLYGGYMARPDFLQRQQKFVADFTKVNQDAFNAYKNSPSAFLDAASAYSPSANDEMSVADNQHQATYLGYDDVGSDRLTITDADIADYSRLFALFAQVGWLKAPVTNVSNLFYRRSAS